jgi:kynurenine formamidase
MNGRDDDVRTISYRRVVDLSHVIDPQIPLWPGDPPITFETVARLDRDGYQLRRFCMGEHSATHINAPSSFHEGAASVDRIPIGCLVAPAVVMDVQREADGDPDYVLGVKDLCAWESHHGRVPANTMVLLNTGWFRRWSDPVTFLGQDALGRCHLPAFGVAAVRMLLNEREVAGVGIDTHGVDEDSAYEVNRQVLARGGVVLENLTNLDQLPPTGTTLVIGVLRLRHGTGSPAAVTAFVP